MTTDKDFKKRVRARMAKTGESYTAARAALLAEAPRLPADVSVQNAAESGGAIPIPDRPGPFAVAVALANTLGDPDGDVRYQAAVSISDVIDAVVRAAPGAALRGEEAAVIVAALRAALSDTEERVRFRVVRLMGRMGNPGAVPGLLVALKVDVAVDVRVCAATALSELALVMRGAANDDDATQTRAVVEGLVAALSDTDARVRRQAAWCLGRVRDRAAASALRTALASDPADDVRKWAATSLGLLGEHSAFDALLSVLRDESAPLRAVAAQALGVLADRRATHALVEALSDVAPTVRREAAWSLRSVEDPASIPALITTARDDKDAAVRNNAVGALGRFASAEVLDTLVHALRDPHALTRQNAAKGLGKIGSARALEPLVAVLKDTEPKVRAMASWALGRLARQPSQEL